jgi:plastocyanin
LKEDGDAAGGGMPVELSGQVNDEGVEQLTGSEPALEMEADDFYFEPTFVQTEAGATVTVTVGNEGDVDHTFTVDSLGISETVAPDETVEVEVEVPGDEALEFYCEFHEGQGMRGAFFTEEGQSVAE